MLLFNRYCQEHFDLVCRACVCQQVRYKTVIDVRKQPFPFPQRRISFGITMWIDEWDREIYYRDVNLFKNQKAVDQNLELLADVLGVPRDELHIVRARFISLVCVCSLFLLNIHTIIMRYLKIDCCEQSTVLWSSLAAPQEQTCAWWTKPWPNGKPIKYFVT